MPDPFIRYEYPKLLDQSREALAKQLNAPVGTIVFVPNATTAINVVLRNLVWDADGKDEILHFTTIYGGCGKTIDYIVDSGRGIISSREIKILYPIEDEEIVSRFRDTVNESLNAGKRPKVCLLDVVSSLPGVRFPFEEMTKACKELNVLSLVDGAQGIGMVHLDLAALDPDFFTSNCHKWGHVPRGCAVFYVPLRHQALIRSTLPTSHGYVSLRGDRFSHLPPNEKSVFVNNFEFMATVDGSPYLCVKDSIKWRKEILGGEERLLDYIWGLAKGGGARVAEILGTTVLENSKGTLTNCGMVNVALPMVVAARAAPADAAEVTGSEGKEIIVPKDEAFAVWRWMEETLMQEYKTFIVLYVYNHRRFWARLSAQVYLDMDDFEWAGNALKEICRRVEKLEYKKCKGAS